jgi:hypothetical protein
MMISASRSTIQDPEVSKNAKKNLTMTKMEKDDHQISKFQSAQICSASLNK